MPFSHYKASLTPDALDAVQTAFDEACAEVSLPHDLDEQTARNLIARRIMDSLESGESDPVRLKAYALRVFNKPNRLC